MNLPINKYAALVSHIARMAGVNGETAGQIVQAMPDHDYGYLYHLILRNKRDELKQHIKKYEPTTATT